MKARKAAEKSDRVGKRERPIDEGRRMRKGGGKKRKGEVERVEKKEVGEGKSKL